MAKHERVEDNLSKEKHGVKTWGEFCTAFGNILLLEPDNAPLLYSLVRKLRIDQLRKRLDISKEHAEKIIDVVGRFEKSGLSTTME